MRRSRVYERLMTRVQAWRLDAAIANGADPDSSAALSLRANRLISRRTRRSMSRGIGRLLEQSRRPPHPFNESAPICWRQVALARPVLQELAMRLAGPAPVDARGVAKLQLLLTDGTSPLFSWPEVDGLEALLATALEALEPRP